MTNTRLKLFLCEDDENLGMILKELLEKKFDVSLYNDGKQGWEYFIKEKYDICLLDIGMPQKDGIELAKDIRNINPTVPIIFITAKGERQTILEGFHAGADDYITKPFSLEELMLRIDAVLRRTNIVVVEQPIRRVYTFGNLTFDVQAQIIEIGNKKTRLTTKENGLMALLCEYSNRTLERAKALEKVWNIRMQDLDEDDSSISMRSIDVYITKLRRILKDEPSIEIKNVHGKGYRLVVPD